MSDTIKFFHPEETFLYFPEKSFCKVVFLKQQNCLILEIESTEDLDHLEEDSLQNEFPKVLFNVDDFPISFQNKKQLVAQTVEIPVGTGEVENEEGEMDEVFYTNLSVNDGDYELFNNIIKFNEDKNGDLRVFWTGEVDDFTEVSDEPMAFEIDCSLKSKKIEIID
ncbi:hypothetical protein GO491_08065 [Flavobacteriaceae bacterium Ap0902]|nr:hypothetical protein [Flavobacteriaceae bacterium Ap0902]